MADEVRRVGHAQGGRARRPGSSSGSCWSSYLAVGARGRGSSGWSPGGSWRPAGHAERRPARARSAATTVTVDRRRSSWSARSSRRPGRQRRAGLARRPDQHGRGRWRTPGGRPAGSPAARRALGPAARPRPCSAFGSPARRPRRAAAHRLSHRGGRLRQRRRAYAQASLRRRARRAGGPADPNVAQLHAVMLAVTVLLAAMAAVNLVFVTRASATDARRVLAVARTLGASPAEAPRASASPSWSRPWSGWCSAPAG